MMHGHEKSDLAIVCAGQRQIGRVEVPPALR
jgi:hypothetical protein